MNWEVPFKTPSGIQKKRSVVLNWCYYASGLHAERRERLEELLAAAPAFAKPKILATLDFMTEMERRGLANKTPKTIMSFGWKKAAQAKKRGGNS